MGHLKKHKFLWEQTKVPKNHCHGVGLDFMQLLTGKKFTSYKYFSWKLKFCVAKVTDLSTFTALFNLILQHAYFCDFVRFLYISACNKTRPDWILYIKIILWCWEAPKKKTFLAKFSLVRTASQDSWWGQLVRTAGEDSWWGQLARTAGEDSWWGQLVRAAGGDC
jgi:hypothetical protein